MHLDLVSSRVNPALRLLCLHTINQRTEGEDNQEINFRCAQMVQTEMPMQITLLLLLSPRDIATLGSFMSDLVSYYDDDSRCGRIFYFSIHLTIYKQRLNGV